jgi:hypothetical protein
MLVKIGQLQFLVALSVFESVLNEMTSLIDSHRDAESQQFGFEAGLMSTTLHTYSPKKAVNY